MTTAIYTFEFLVPVQRDHIVVVTRVEHAKKETMADVVVERFEVYTGPITLQMAATQQRQRRGIHAT